MSDTKYGKTALIDDVTATTTGLTRRQVEQVVNATLDTIATRLRQGQGVTLTGFGTFSTRERPARSGVNPQTRQKIQIPAGTRAHWKPASTLLATKAAGGSYARERGGATNRPKGRAVPGR